MRLTSVKSFLVEIDKLIFECYKKVIINKNNLCQI